MAEVTKIRSWLSEYDAWPALHRTCRIQTWQRLQTRCLDTPGHRPMGSALRDVPAQSRMVRTASGRAGRYLAPARRLSRNSRDAPRSQGNRRKTQSHQTAASGSSGTYPALFLHRPENFPPVSYRYRLYDG